MGRRTKVQAHWMIVRLRNKRPSHCNGAGDRWSVVLSCSVADEERRHTEEPTTKPVPPTSLKEKNSKKKVLVERCRRLKFQNHWLVITLSSIWEAQLRDSQDFSPHLERVSLRRFSFELKLDLELFLLPLRRSSPTSSAHDKILIINFRPAAGQFDYDQVASAAVVHS